MSTFGAPPTSGRPVPVGKGGPVQLPGRPYIGSVRAGWVRFMALDLSGSVDVQLGDGPCRVTDNGIGGWETETRPGRRPAVWWNAPEAIRQTVPVLFDGFPTDSVEQAIDALEQLGKAPQAHVPPPILRVEGAGVRRRELTWVIEAIEWADDPTVVVRADGDRVRQAGTVTLLHPDEAEVVTSPAQAVRVKSKKPQGASRGPLIGGRKGRGTSHSSGSTYVVKRGDTLSSIAARELGDAGKWTTLANLNGIRDPKNLRVGQRIRLG